MYSVLRRKEQLAYSPLCFFDIYEDQTKFIFYLSIQSHHYPPEYLSARVQNLIYEVYNSDNLERKFQELLRLFKQISLKSNSVKSYKLDSLDGYTFFPYNNRPSYLIKRLKQTILLSWGSEEVSFEEFKESYLLLFQHSPRAEIQIYRDGIEIPSVAYPDTVGNFSSLVEGIKDTEVIINRFKSFELWESNNQKAQTSYKENIETAQTQKSEEGGELYDLPEDEFEKKDFNV